MLAIRYTTQAKKDIRKLARQGKDVAKLASVLNDIDVQAAFSGPPMAVTESDNSDTVKSRAG